VDGRRLMDPSCPHVANRRSPMASTLRSTYPILRWAGGKRRVARKLQAFMPDTWNNYIEPMAGGASLFFQVTPKKATLADLNPDLINFYRVLRDNPSSLVNRLKRLRASKKNYYRMRETRPRSKLDRAVRFAYLNRLCWNGLYRVNKVGRFNVPMGDRLPKKLWNTKELYRAAKTLASTDLVTGDFKLTLRKAKRGDFVFIDPPYPRGAPVGTSFNRYCSDSFSRNDHKRLGRAVRSLDKRGVATMILLASSKNILSCYPASLDRRRLRSKSLISCNASSRRLVDEIVLTNYPISDDL
jgi:DNA adenine methylase